MGRVDTLREQANTLRMIAITFSPTLRADLLVLASRCDEMAREAAREIAHRMAQPISGEGRGRK